MSVYLTKEQTEIWKKQGYHQMILATVLFCVSFVVSVLVPEISASIMTFYFGGIIGILIFLITTPTIHYFVKDYEIKNGE